jgi:hypothetical protein
MTEAGDLRERESFKQGKTMGNKGWQALERWLKKIKIGLSQKNFLCQYHQSPNPLFLPCSTLGTSPD